MSTGGVTGVQDLPTVVFVHGAGMDHTVWRFQTRWLANRGYRVLAPDLPGHGASTGTPRPSIPEWAAWLLEFVDDADVAPVPVVGHSMGALIALEAAVQRPDVIERLVLVGASPHMTVHPDLMDAAHRNDALASELIAAWSLPAAFAGGHPEPGTWEAGGVTRLVQRSAHGVLATDLSACQAYDGGARARLVAVDTLVVSGSDDRMAPSRGARELTAMIPGAELTVLAGAGHEPMLQTPRRFNATLERFLTASGKPVPG